MSSVFGRDLVREGDARVRIVLTVIYAGQTTGIQIFKFII